MEVDLSDENIYSEIKKQNNTQNTQNNKENNKEKNNIIIVNKYKKDSSLSRFIRNLLLIILSLFLIYITIFRYVLGYNFFKNKEYKKTAAVLSPEIISLSTLLL
jgi:hypothetical protein